MNKPATVGQLNYIHGLYNQRERDEVLRKYNIRTLNELSMKEASELIDAKKDFNYCPFCGAKMDGKDEEK